MIGMEDPYHQCNADHFSDDDRSIAADSWSVKSEYGGSVLDSEELIRQTEAMEAMAVATINEDYRDEDERFESMLGLQSHWDGAYADELANFRQYGDAGEIWFGKSVMDTIAEWTAKICAAASAASAVAQSGDFTKWNVLDIGTGNGLYLHAMVKQGFTDLTGVDYSEGAIELAKAVAQRNGHANIKFLVDNVVETNLTTQYKLVNDKGTLDAIGLHPEGTSHRKKYWNMLSKLVAPGGVLVITSCNNTKEELLSEVDDDAFEYVDHVGTYPTFRFGGGEGSRVATVAFIRKRCC